MRGLTLMLHVQLTLAQLERELAAERAALREQVKVSPALWHKVLR